MRWHFLIYVVFGYADDFILLADSGVGWQCEYKSGLCCYLGVQVVIVLCTGACSDLPDNKW
jgi:hypothetical protein